MVTVASTHTYVLLVNTMPVNTLFSTPSEMSTSVNGNSVVAPKPDDGVQSSGSTAPSSMPASTDGSVGACRTVTPSDVMPEWASKNDDSGTMMVPPDTDSGNVGCALKPNGKEYCGAKGMCGSSRNRGADVSTRSWPDDRRDTRPTALAAHTVATTVWPSRTNTSSQVTELPSRAAATSAKLARGRRSSRPGRVPRPMDTSVIDDWSSVMLAHATVKAELSVWNEADTPVAASSPMWITPTCGAVQSTVMPVLTSSENRDSGLYARTATTYWPPSCTDDDV